jgi:predicted transcriptional regulator
MTERSYTPQEAHQIAVTAAREALAMFNAKPNKSAYTVAEAAEFLGVKPRTIYRLRLKKNSAGKINYETLIEARDNK